MLQRSPLPGWRQLYKSQVALFLSLVESRCFFAGVFFLFFVLIINEARPRHGGEKSRSENGYDTEKEEHI